jgi:5-methylcytosine-specific restriction endonuclease McrA
MREGTVTEPGTVFTCLYCFSPIVSNRRRVQCGSYECRKRWDVAKTSIRTALKRAAGPAIMISPERVIRAAGGICYLCRTALCPLAVYPSPQTTVMDHVVPLSRGGAHSEEALRAVHHHCNLRKSDKLLTALSLPLPPPYKEWADGHLDSVAS